MKTQVNTVSLGKKAFRSAEPFNSTRMNDTEYHALIKRLPVGFVPKTRKPLMSMEEMKELLTGEVWIEEKLDGTLVHYPPSGENQPYDLFYEYLKIHHTVFYDRLPSWYIILDVAEGSRVLKPHIREQFGIPPPLIEYKPDMTPDYFFNKLSQYLNRISAFSSRSMIEGIVIKNYEKQLFGKVVRKEFYEGIEESYIKRRKTKMNRLLTTK